MVLVRLDLQRIGLQFGAFGLTGVGGLPGSRFKVQGYSILANLIIRTEGSKAQKRGDKET